MKLRLQADADFNHRIVSGLRRLEPAIDFQTSEQAALSGKPDPEVLRVCADDGRLLVTHDKSTMPMHFAAFVAHHTSPGVIIVPQDLPIGDAIEDLYLAWTASEAEEWVNSIRWFPF